MSTTEVKAESYRARSYTYTDAHQRFDSRLRVAVIDVKGEAQYHGIRNNVRLWFTDGVTSQSRAAYPTGDESLKFTLAVDISRFSEIREFRLC